MRQLIHSRQFHAELALSCLLFSLAFAFPVQAQAPAFTWRMHERYGLDANNDGFMDLPNSFEYVHAMTGTWDGTTPVVPRFRVTFSAIPHRHASTPTYSWTVSGPETQSFQSSAPSWTTTLQEGNYTVTLAVSAGVFQQSNSRKVRIEDLLIVSIGDSYSSGEGNPERSLRADLQSSVVHKVYWADDGRVGAGFTSYSYPKGATQQVTTGGNPATTRSPIVEDHLRAHRSTLSWPSQVALALETADLQTSVTFVSFAASGAVTANLSRQSYPGLQGEPATRHISRPLLPQLDDVAHVVGRRRIDALLVSAGANDAGFSHAIAALVLQNTVGTSITSADIMRAIDNGNWTRFGTQGNFFQAFVDNQYDWRSSPGLQNLARELGILSAKIRTLNVFNTYLVEYPNPTSELDQQGNLVYCDDILGEVATQATIDSNEAAWADRNVVQRLNTYLQRAAAEHSWAYVGGPMADSDGHGYCADRPYPAPLYGGNPTPFTPPSATGATARWFRRAGESSIIQGPSEPIDSTGTLHPNEFGHQAVKRRVLAQLHLPVQMDSIGIQDADDQLSEAVTASRRSDGVLLMSRRNNNTGHMVEIELYEGITPPTDVDMRSVFLSTNEHFDINILVDRSVPHIQLFSPSGQTISADPGVIFSQRRSGSEQRFVKRYRTAAAGNYVISISSGANRLHDPATGEGDGGLGETFNYRLRLAPIAGSPDNTIRDANTLTVGSVVGDHTIEGRQDVDMFAVQTANGQRVRVKITPHDGLNPILRIFDAAGTKLAEGQPYVDINSTGGIYYVGVTSSNVLDYNPSIGIAQPITTVGTGALRPRPLPLTTGRYDLAITPLP